MSGTGCLLAAEDLSSQDSTNPIERIKVPASVAQDASSGIDFAKVTVCLKTRLLVAFCANQNIFLIFKHVYACKNIFEHLKDIFYSSLVWPVMIQRGSCEQ